uniref:Uncharacterized protein n=1 Tax=Glossina pallidipes TaxID=7398 RepID=A0A1A9ZUD8_GLOPL
MMLFYVPLESALLLFYNAERAREVCIMFDCGVCDGCVPLITVTNKETRFIKKYITNKSSQIYSSKVFYDEHRILRPFKHSHPCLHSLAYKCQYEDNYVGSMISPYDGPSVRYDYISLDYRNVENSGYRNPFYLTNHPVEIQKSPASVFLHNIVLLFILTLSRQGCNKEFIELECEENILHLINE